MPTIRANHSGSQRWFLLSRDSAQDARLSFKARGILAYLLSKPDGWTWQEEELSDASPDGRDAVRSGLRELKAFGYISAEREVDPATKRFRYVKTVYEVPQTGFPSTGFPSAAKPRTENPTLDNTDRESTEGENTDHPPIPPPPQPTPQQPTPRPPTPSAGWVDGGSAAPPGQPVVYPESIAYLTAQGAKSTKAIRSAARLPLARVKAIVTEDRKRDKGIGASVNRCIAEADDPEIAAQIAAAAQAPPARRLPAPPPLPEAPPLSPAQMRAIIAARQEGPPP